MISKAVLLGLCALPVLGCSEGTGDPESNESSTGLFQVGLRSRHEGVRYELEARFIISGPNGPGAASRAAPPGAATFSLELEPGSYAVELQPGYRVYQDQAVVLTPIDAELASDATQAFEIAAAATTRVEYRFVIAAGTLAFGGDELE